MKTFGFKAFLRTISIVGSIFLLRYSIASIIQNDNIPVRIIYFIGVVVVIALIFILTNILVAMVEKIADDKKAKK